MRRVFANGVVRAADFVVILNYVRISSNSLVVYLRINFAGLGFTRLIE